MLVYQRVVLKHVMFVGWVIYVIKILEKCCLHPCNCYNLPSPIPLILPAPFHGPKYVVLIDTILFYALLNHGSG
jgi:hypothetical protein